MRRRRRRRRWGWGGVGVGGSRGKDEEYILRVKDRKTT